MNDKEKDKKPVVGVKPLVTPPKTGQTPAPLPMWSGSVGDKLAGLPMFRGSAQKPNSLLGRLKNLKTKDVAFIGAGLAVLVMAPLAEYLVSESSDDAGRLTQGFDQKGDFFQQGGGPNEPGILGLARGGLLGENPDIITPLNARDPSSLIMASGGERREPEAAPAPEVKRDAPKDNVWDKVVSSAKSGAKAASKKVGLPKPNVKLAGALNGLRSLSGGSTGAKLALDKPDSKGLFSSPRKENHLAPTQAAPGYRGAGARSPFSGTGGGHGGFDGRGAGPGGSGGGAAGDVMGGGVAGGGRGTGSGWAGDGEATKSPGGSSTKDNKALGENLEFLRRKMEMEKAIDLKWAKKRYDELERKKMVEQTLVQTAQQAFLKVLDKLLEGKKDGGGGGGGGGGPSGGGGAPSGEPAPKDDTALPGGATTPSGLAKVGAIGKVERPDSAKAQLTASKAKVNEAGSSLEALGKNGGELSAKAGALEAGDDKFKAIAKHVRAAAQDVQNAQKALQGDLGKANEPFAGHQQLVDEMTQKLPKLESSQQKAGETKTAIEGELGKLVEPKWKKDEKYENGGAATSFDGKAGQALTDAEAGKRARSGADMPSQAEADPAQAAKALQERGAEVGKILAGMMESAPADIKPAIAKAQAELPGLFNDAAANVQAAGKNVQIAFDAARESGFRVNQVQLTYELAQEAAAKAGEKVKTVSGQAKTAIEDYKDYTLDNQGKGPDKRDKPFTDAGDAKTAATGLQQPLSELQQQVRRTRQRLQ